MSKQTTHRESTSPRQNHLLAALTAAELEPLLPHMALTELALGTALYEPGSRMDDLYFPISGIVSLLHTLADGHTTELAIVGNDGCIGIAVLLGGDTTPSQAMVQIAGYAYRIPSSAVVATAVTMSVWPVRVAWRSPVATSHTRTVRS